MARLFWNPQVLKCCCDIHMFSSSRKKSRRNGEDDKIIWRFECSAPVRLSDVFLHTEVHKGIPVHAAATVLTARTLGLALHLAMRRLYGFYLFGYISAPGQPFSLTPQCPAAPGHLVPPSRKSLTRPAPRSSPGPLLSLHAPKFPWPQLQLASLFLSVRSQACSACATFLSPKPFIYIYLFIWSTKYG